MGSTWLSAYAIPAWLPYPAQWEVPDFHHTQYLAPLSCTVGVHLNFIKHRIFVLKILHSGRVWLVTSRLGEGKIANLFFTVNINNKICLGQEQYLPVSIQNTGLQNLLSGKYLAFRIRNKWLPYPAQSEVPDFHYMQ